MSAAKTEVQRHTATVELIDPPGMIVWRCSFAKQLRNERSKLYQPNPMVLRAYKNTTHMFFNIEVETLPDGSVKYTPTIKLKYNGMPDTCFITDFKSARDTVTGVIKQLHFDAYIHFNLVTGIQVVPAQEVNRP